MYASAADLQDRYPMQDLAQLTGDPAGVTVDLDRLGTALADAAQEIDGYLVGRYVLPLQRVPAVLKLLACNIAMYQLQALRPMSSIEDARKRYEDAISYLTKVSKGTVQLGLSDSEEPAAQGSGPEWISATRMFSRDAMRGL